MDTGAIIDRVLAYSSPQVDLPVLVTSPAEIIETCREDGRLDLVARLRICDEGDFMQIARKLGDVLMEGGDYWEGIPAAVERALGT
jgi:hypothetical protein